MQSSIEADLVLDAHSQVGEGPVWDAQTNRLIWVDVTQESVHQYSLASNSDQMIPIGQLIGAAALRTSGGLVLALKDGFGLLPAGSDRVEMIAATEADKPNNRMNDGKVDSSGRFWAGTMSLALDAGAGTLYRLDADHQVIAVLRDLRLSNGLGWSPDDRNMYFIDSLTQGIDVFSYDPSTGTIRNRRRLVEIPQELGMPDGMSVDADGCIWVGLWGGWAVHRYTPEGRLDRVVRLPVSQVTSCAFGGSDLGDLYITSAAHQLPAEQLAIEPLAGGLFCCRPGPVGFQPHRFGG
jgi:sugar lactone lactonase YvrE